VNAAAIALFVAAKERTDRRFPSIDVEPDTDKVRMARAEKSARRKRKKQKPKQ
jgi:hypothetical protein